MSRQDRAQSETAAPLVAAEVDALLARFGVAPLRSRDEAEAAVLEELARRGHSATVVELRHGRLLLETSAASLRLLRYDEEHILSALQARVPGTVRELRVRVTRGRRSESVRGGDEHARSPQQQRGDGR